MYIINGKEVDYLYITKNKNGDTIVEYSEQFNIVTAHISETMKRLREDNLNAIITDYPRYGIIVILLDKIEDVHSVLSSLKIPYGCYEINEEDAIITVDIPVINELLE